jgi:hypothetical protein
VIHPREYSVVMKNHGTGKASYFLPSSDGNGGKKGSF